MSIVFTQEARGTARNRLGLIYKLAVFAYILAVVLFSYREGLTLVAKVAAGVMGGLFLLRAIPGGARIAFPAEYRLLFTWFLVAVISSVFSRDPATALPRVITLAQVLPAAFLITTFLVWNGDTKFYWVSMLVAAVALGVVSLVNPTQFAGVDGRMFGTLGNANGFATLLAASVALALGFVVCSRLLLVRGLCLGIAAFCFYLVTSTGSRMGMLAAFGAVLATYVCYQRSGTTKRLGRSLAVLLFGAAVIGGSILLLTASVFYDRLAVLGEGVSSGDFSSVGDTSLRDRAIAFQTAIELFLESPVLGAGLNVFQTAGGEVRASFGYSHNNYAEILASTGVVGAILYFAVYCRWWSKLVALRSLARDPRYIGPFTQAAALLVVILIVDVASVTYYEKLSWLLMAGVIAEIYLLGRHNRPATPGLMKGLEVELRAQPGDV